jgi:hypothetical protein
LSHLLNSRLQVRVLPGALFPTSKDAVGRVDWEAKIVTWDGPYEADTMPKLSKFEDCGAMVHDWGLDTHAAFHARLDRIELEAAGA